jgi:SAM-dependent methyltransferase
MGRALRAPRRSRGLPGRTRAADAPRPVPCQICSADTVPGLDLGHQPISDRLLSAADLNRPEVFYPMRLHHCPQCGLTQLGYIVPPEEVYRDFPFVSGTTKTARRHLQSLPARLVRMAGLDRRSFAVDIGSNDGTLLEGYARHGVRVLGVDPAGDPVRIAVARGIPTLHAFFNTDTAKVVRRKHGPADAITAAGVFGHIADLDGVMRGVAHLLGPRGIFVSDNQYLLDMVERLHYDNMFHQHLRYYSLRPMLHLHEKYGLEVFDVDRSEVYGGSFRVYAARPGARKVSRRVAALLALEDEKRLYDENTWRTFAAKVDARRRTLVDAVHAAVSAGRKVIGLGAPAKAATVCNYCRLGPEAVSYITEVNPLRIGMYLPGTHIPIVDERSMFTDPVPPDVGILFAWNYYDEIVPKLRRQGFQGEVICP